MDTVDDTLRIGYAGMLAAHTPGRKRRGFFDKIKSWVWTYRNDLGHHITRSGYFFFKGIQRFKEKYPDLQHKLQVQLWGMIAPENKTQVHELGIEDIVEIEGYFNRDTSNERLQSCDLLFLPLEVGDDPIFIPGKTFDYIKREKPVLILGHPSDCTNILLTAGVGILVDPFSTEAIADTLAELIRTKTELPKKYTVDWQYMEDNFHFKNLSQQLVNLFEELK